MLQPSLPAVTSSYVADFPPQYERFVNDNMRMFAKPTGQLGPQALDKIEDSKHYEKKRTWKTLLLGGVLLLLISLAAVTLGIVIDRMVDKKYSPEPTVTKSATITTTSTSMTIRAHTSVSTVFKTKTASASIPTRVAAAASSYLGAESSSVESRMASISVYLMASPWSSVSPTAPLAEQSFSTTIGARSLASRALPTDTAGSLSTWHGICGIRGIVYLHKKSINVKRHEKHTSKVTTTTTVTSIVQRTSTSTTISRTTSWTTTTAKIPQSIISAANAYYSSLHSSESSMVSIFATQSTFGIPTLTPTPSQTSTSVMPPPFFSETLSSAASSASSGSNGPIWCEGVDCSWNI